MRIKSNINKNDTFTGGTIMSLEQFNKEYIKRNQFNGCFKRNKIFTEAKSEYQN